MAVKNNSNVPSSLTEFNTILVNPAAGPLTESLEPLMPPITMPPITPPISPESKGAFWANAIPKQSGSATKKTTIPDFKSVKKNLNIRLL